jgi:hypothetical protein
MHTLFYFLYLLNFLAFLFFFFLYFLAPFSLLCILSFIPSTFFILFLSLTVAFFVFVSVFFFCSSSLFSFFQSVRFSPLPVSITGHCIMEKCPPSFLLPVVVILCCIINHRPLRLFTNRPSG